MWVIFFSLFIIPLCSSMSFEEDPHSFLAITDGDSSSNVAGCVSAITGDYLISEDDFCFAGAEPTLIRRNYISSRSNEKGTGWHFELPRAIFYVGEPVNAKKGLFGVVNVNYRGIGLRFIPDGRQPRLTTDDKKTSAEEEEEIYRFEKDARFKVDPNSFEVGLTNYSNGQIGEHHRLLQAYAIFKANLQSFVVYFADGRELYFEVNITQPNYRAPISTPYPLKYECVKERLENGNYIEYSYIPNVAWHSEEFSWIRTLDPTQKHILSSVRYQYEKKDKHQKGYPSLNLFGSDGKKIHFENWYAERSVYWALQNVQGTEGPDESYTYDLFYPKKHVKNTLITRRNLPDGRTMRIEYYTAGDHVIQGKSIHVSSSGYDRNYLKVKRIYAQAGIQGKEIPIYEFLYNWDRVTQRGGSTDVYDVMGNLTKYSYDDQLRLTKIETHEKDRLMKTECFRWGSVKDHPAMYLCTKTVLDEHKKPISAKTYHYDSNGNLVLERAFGNWTGSQAIPLQLNELGDPIEGTGEVIETIKTYTNDSRSLLESTKEGDLETRFTYHKSAVKLTSILQLDRGIVNRRKFFLYDHHLFLTAIIEDDGVTSEFDDLTGVSQRTFERYSNRMESPYIGLPQRIEKGYLDLATGRECLLHAEERAYGSHGKVISTKVYDEHNHYLYSMTYARDEKGKIISETNPLGQVARYEYDACQNKIKERHFDGTTETKLIYDLAGRNISNILHSKCGTFVERYSYNTQSKIQEKIDALGQKTRYFYDTFGRIIEEQSPLIERVSGGMSPDTEQWTYNCLGFVSSTTTPSGGTTSITYSTAAKPLTVTHPNGAFESYFYDLRARLVHHILPDLTEVFYEYDGFSRLLQKKTVDSTGKLLAQEAWSYSGFQLLSHQAPSGMITEYQYDSAGRKIRETIIGSDLVKEFTYNGFDLLIEEKISSGFHTQIFRKKYDFLNRITWEGTFDTQGLVVEKLYSYDARSNCTQTEWRKGEESAVTIKEFDDLDRVTLEIDPEGLRTSYTYQMVEDERFTGKILKKTEFSPKGYQTIQLFDPKNRVMDTLITDLYNRPLHRELKTYHPSGIADQVLTQVYHGYNLHENNTTLYEINTLGKVISQTRSANHPLSRTESFSYDLKGRLLEHVKEDGISIKRTYNGLDQVASLKSSQGDLDYEYHYHSSGNIEHAIDRLRKTRVYRKYDDFGRLISEQQTHGVGISYAYDDLHGKIAMSLPSWGTVQYHYGDFYLGEIAILPRKKGDSYSHQFLAYSFLADPILEQDVDGGRIEKQYSPAGKLMRIDSPYGIHLIDEQNTAGQITSQTWTSLTNTQTKDYYYDLLGHLAFEADEDNDCSYHYSSTHQVIEQGRTELQYNSLQELIRSGKQPVQFDQAGRLISNKPDQSTCQYQYDSLDRLTKVSCAEYTIAYEYDPFDRIAIRTVTEPCWRGWSECTKETLFIWDENNLIGLLDGETRTYDEVRVLRPSPLSDWGTMVALEQDGVLLAALPDIQGNLWQLNTPTSSREARFSSYGKQETPSISQFGFCSKWQDPHTNLVYFGKRFYNPKTCSFLTKDPKGFVDGLNLYGFCKGDPLSYIDRYGLEAIDPSAGFLERMSQYFDRMIDGLGFACRKLGEGFYQLNEDFNIIPVFRRLGQAIGNYLQGETNPRARERSQVITAGLSGSGTTAPFKILATTGIKTTKSETEEFAQSIHNALGAGDVSVISNSTDGLLYDIIEVGYQKCGGKTHSTSLLAAEIKTMIETSDKPLEEIRIMLIAHSQGGLTVANALKLLSPQERSCLTIATFGSASLFFRTTESAVAHFVSSRDPIPLLTNPVSYFTNEDVLHVDASEGKIFDHSFANESYQNALSNYLKSQKPKNL